MRLLRMTAAVHEDIKIQVPSMGDSISEGSVAEIEKQPGAWPTASYQMEPDSSTHCSLDKRCLHQM